MASERFRKHNITSKLSRNQYCSDSNLPNIQRTSELGYWSKKEKKKQTKELESTHAICHVCDFAIVLVQRN